MLHPGIVDPAFVFHVQEGSMKSKGRIVPPPFVLPWPGMFMPPATTKWAISIARKNALIYLIPDIVAMLGAFCPSLFRARVSDVWTDFDVYWKLDEHSRHRCVCTGYVDREVSCSNEDYSSSPVTPMPHEWDPNDQSCPACTHNNLFRVRIIHNPHRPNHRMESSELHGRHWQQGG